VEKIDILAKKLSKGSREAVLKRVYAHVKSIYLGKGNSYNLRNILKLRDFKTEKILKKKEFFFCHTQNRVLIDLLIATKKFKIKDIKIRKELFKHLYIHQYIEVDLKNKKFKLDPFYKIFQEID
jgi:hypothetical protein